ncbi:sulfatase [Caulobacter sp.]|uniref:sulfatase family protein n=1 Tax=Caulobacter sp. TaxID=78 RepID=UPI001B2ED221|nr:sulfatase [Caulobacter sp.]MBO9545450.1 sulfatase [Caulobacter sp.]
MALNRRNLLNAGAVAAAVSALPKVAGAKPPRKPNFVVILCDDLGFGDVQPFGGKIPTPSLTRMAEEGLTGQSYYAAANMCTPSRAGLLTGRYPIRTGLAWEVILIGDERGLPLEEKTIAHALKADYATALIGKWHLGHTAPWWPPTKHGFDQFYGIPYSHDMAPLQVFDIKGPDEVPGKDVDLHDLQQLFVARAEQFIEQNKDRPFFLELALSAPHLPAVPSKNYDGVTIQGPYGDFVREIDGIVGRVLSKLKALGLAEDTLVLFTSDNGPWFEGSSGPLRDRKGGAAYDGGYHVPFLAWRPGHVPAGKKTSAILSAIDFLPTFCAMAGYAPPAGVELDGKDVSDVLLKGAASPHDAILLFNNEDIVGIRTQRWKFVAKAHWRGGIQDFSKRGYDELYDIEADPSESYSVAERHPEVVAEMKQRLAEAQGKFDGFRKGIPPFFQKASAPKATHD